MSAYPANIQFLDAIKAAGIDYAGPIFADGNLHRFKANGDRGPNGWYLLHGDGIPAGAFGHWKQGINVTWCAKDNTELTDTERTERDRRFAAILAEREADRHRQHDAASHEARAILDAAQNATDDHPYLVRKQVRAHPGVKCGDWPQRRIENCLLIPLRDASGQLVSLEAIYPGNVDGERDKDFLKGGRKAGAFFVIGDPASGNTLLLAEGYATAATLHEATGCTAVMAADAGNLKAVAAALRVLYHDKAIIVCADNDRQTEGNPGLTKASAAAKTINGLLAVPQFADDEAGSDFNDLALLHGMDAVRIYIEAARKSTAAEGVAAEDSRPAIHIKGGALPEMVDQAELAMLGDTSRPAIYKRDIGLVRTARAASDSVTGHIRRQAGSLRIIPVDSGYLLERFTQAAKWLRYNERSSSWKPGNAPKLAVDTYLSRVGRWNCDTLTGIIESPTLRPDGSILDIPGYDAVTGLIFDPGATRFKPIPINPTLNDAREAVKVLLEVIKEFPFIADHDSAVVLVAILTALIRKSLKSAPMIGFTAPVMGSGKSLLADCIALIATGRRAPAWTYTGEPEEERKHITSALIAGDPVICIDNITAPMDGDRLCSVLTQETITDRLLGVMKQVTLSTATCWLATGNNLEIRGDLATRALVCRLDAATENPEERKFQTDLLTWIPDNRAALVRAALTILRAYHVAGRPRQPIKQFGRFETWSDWPRSALVWVGVPDPCKARIHVAAADPTRQQLGALLAAWYAVFKEDRVTTAEVIKAASVTVSGGEACYSTPGGDDLRQALLTVAGRGEVIDPRAFGQYLRKNQGRMIGQRRLEQIGTHGTRVLWRVCAVGAVTAVTDYEQSNFSSEKLEVREERNTAKNTGGNSGNCANCTNCTEGTPKPPDLGDGDLDSPAASPPPMDAEPAPPAPPPPAPADTHRRFTIVLKSGKTEPFITILPITLGMMEATGRRMHGENFAYAKVQS